MVERNGAKVRELWVCNYPGCGEAFCCTIPTLKPSYPLWCDNPCRFTGTDRCTKNRGYSGNLDSPYKPEVLEKTQSGEHLPFVVKEGKCPKHFE